ncbi:hypothetical protein, partial [Paenibacillus sp. GCM10012306]|uniref:hypothetical protein n=1 Tax=Paenibacillus sp. GCM10012306 TaxID=3317342 RepID=UPI003621283C
IYNFLSVIDVVEVKVVIFFKIKINIIILIKYILSLVAITNDNSFETSGANTENLCSSNPFAN